MKPYVAWQENDKVAITGKFYGMFKPEYQYN